MRSALKLLAERGRSLQIDQRASIGVLFAMAFPVLAVGVGMSVEFGEVIRTKAKLQNIVDAAALSGANEVSYGSMSAATQRAQAFATGEASQVKYGWTVSTTATADPSAPSVTVVQQATRPSMFGSLLPPGGFHITVTATAVPNSLMPLCVLGSDTHGNVVSLQSTSTLTGTGCLIQSNGDLQANNSARITAGAVRAAGAAKGMIYPPAIADAPTVPDPFIDLPINIPTSCINQNLQLNSGTTSLSPGVHCGNVQLTGYAQLVLSPGEHYFTHGSFDVQDFAQITGTDVVLIFKGQYNMNLKEVPAYGWKAGKVGSMRGLR